jgi:hypothetical protein
MTGYHFFYSTSSRALLTALATLFADRLSFLLECNRNSSLSDLAIGND